MQCCSTNCLPGPSLLTRKVRLATPPIEMEEVTTPPIIPSSSPGVDMMEVSPLPHKAPYFAAQVTLPSPSPEPTPEENLISPDLLSVDDFTPTQPLLVQAPTFLPLPEYVLHSTEIVVLAC